MARKRRLTPEVLLTFPNVSDARIDPAGRSIAYVQSEVVREKTKLTRQHIWIVDAEGGNARQFTHGPRADFSPRWSPDGTKLAFLSDRIEDGRLQVFLIDRAGGEAKPLAELKGQLDTSGGKDALQWSPDGKRLAFVMVDPETKEEKKKKKKKDDAIEFEKRHKFARLWTLDLATRELKQVTRGKVQVWEFQWSPDSRAFALIASDLPYEWSWYRSRVSRVSASGGLPRTLYKPAKRQLALPRWSPDRSQIAFTSSVWSDRGICQGCAFVLDLRSRNVRELAPGYVGSFGCLAWTRNGRALLTAGHEQGQAALGKIDLRSGRITTLWREPVAIAEPGWPHFTLSADQRRMAVVRHEARAARNVWRVDLAGGAARPTVRWRCLTDSVPQLRDYALGRQEIVRWTARDGLPIHGILIKPVGYVPGRRYPTIVGPHGGPASMMHNGLNTAHFCGQLLANRGYVVFLPNFRGSTGFGLAFAEANVGDMGGMDFQDIEAGVEALIERGIADPNRLGVGGWSYGGFMTCWMVTQTPRYKAAVMGAGISNWLSFHGNSRLHTWDANHYDASPYELDGVYARFSAMHYVHQVKTPTLVLHAEKDEDVPAEQGFQFYRALRDHGIKTEMVVYPREGHGISERHHWVDRHRRIAAWFDKHLKR